MSRTLVPFFAGIADEREFQLRFAVLTTADRSEVRYFASPMDAEGVLMLLSPRERELLVLAPAKYGFHAIEREEVAEANDSQLWLDLGKAVAA